MAKTNKTTATETVPGRMTAANIRKEFRSNLGYIINGASRTELTGMDRIAKLATAGSSQLFDLKNMAEILSDVAEAQGAREVLTTIECIFAGLDKKGATRSPPASNASRSS